jgi:hypothetical protein
MEIWKWRRDPVQRSLLINQSVIRKNGIYIKNVYRNKEERYRNEKKEEMV